METQKRSSSLPAGTRQERAKTARRSRWLGLLMTFVLLFAANLSVRAAMEFGAHSNIIHHPTWAEPWIVIDLHFYDTDGSDSFFLHKPAEGSTRGPAMYIDGVYIDSFDSELAWPNSDSDTEGTGNDKALNDERSHNSWWKGTHTKTRNGKTYTVRFFDPALDNARFHVKVFIWIENLELDKTHSIKIKGYWKTNNSGYSLKEKTWTANAIPSSYSEPTNAKMIDNGHYSFNGGLNSGYGPTWVGTNATADGSNYVAHESLTSVKEYAKGQTSYSNLTFPLVRTSLYETVTIPTEYVVSRPCTVEGYSRDVYFYKWHNLIIPCFPRAANVIAEGNKWNKTVSLSWSSEVYDSNKCITDGKWYVFRKNPRDNSVKIVGSEIAYNTHTLTDNSTSLDYGIPYTYYVCFVPNGWTVESWEDAAGLWASKAFTLLQEYQFKAFTAEGYDEKIELSWNLESFGNANNSNTYDVVLQRSVNNNTNWVDVYTQTINSSTILSGSYSDYDVSNPCTNYYYRLMVMAQDTTFYSIEKVASITGVSKVTDITASRGTYTGRVRIQWEAEQYGNGTTYYTVRRRPLGSGDDRWVTLYTTNGTATSYNYQDDTAQPGDYYEYQVISDTKCETGNSMVQNEVKTDGFCMARGVVSGRISYGTGTAVNGVRVTLVPSSDSGNDVQAFYSLRLQGIGEGVTWPVPQAMKTTTTSPYTIQFFLRPETNDASRTANAVLLEEEGTNAPLLQLSPYDDENERYTLINGSSTTNVYIKRNEFTLVTLRYDGTNLTVSTFDKNREGSSSSKAGSGLSADNLHIGYSLDSNKPQFQGYIDEIRIYSRALSDAEIESYADHTLACTEDGLVAYIPLDEGIQVLDKAYDYSKTSGAANENHGDLAGGTFSTVIPDSTQLGLLGYTDVNGNYVVRGVPFNGDGTNYSILPFMGVHKFSPNKQSRYISASSIVHSGVDFEDVSSFRVRGTVYYAGTTYPVEGVSFAVDGVTCTREGNIITTDADGNYEISVPIGDHYITMSKQGHTFEHNGRYPDNPDPNSQELVTFDQEVSNLIFYDTTLVPIAGRVVGGATEAEKPLGFGESDNNIGQAQIVMTPTRNNVRMNVLVDTSQGGLQFVTNPNERELDKATTRVNSSASVGGGDNYCNNITITTDAASGEFAVMVPPIEYRVSSITIPSQSGISFDLPRVDASDMQDITDSIANELGGYDKFKYKAKVVAEYDATPTFTVTQVTENGQPTAGFGEEKITVDEEEVPIYTADANGTVTYNYGAPIFKMFEPYFFKITAYEEYVNQDDPTDIKLSQRPLEGYIVTIGNELSSAAEVNPAAGNADDGAVVSLAENQLQLDSLGQVVYKWRGGFPNIIAPYYRTLTITYGETGTENPWRNANDPFKGIVLGELPTGNNFITKGPNHIDLILRDPGGSGSQAWFEKGGSFTIDYTYKSLFSTEENIKAVSHLGVSAEIGFGLGTITMTDVKAKYDLTTETTGAFDGQWGHVYSSTTETSERISTSDDPDFVGRAGDVFMGRATNVIFGDNKYLHIEKVGSQYGLNVGSVISYGQQFATKFVYTERDIINNEIPKLEQLRNALLKPEGTTSSTDIVYVTSLSEDDENYGKKGTYRLVVPAGHSPNYTDKVQEYNSFINGWKELLASNEAVKVKAINNRDKYLKENVSFSSGTIIENTSSTAKDTTYTNEQHFMMSLHLGLGTGFEVNGTGVEAEINATNGGGYERDTVRTTTHVDTYGYKLAESGTADALSVDVFNAPDGYGPIFVTRAGQTSCPFEDEEKTQFYRPGQYTLSAKTMKVEDPDISAESTIVTGVPSGKAAVFSLVLQNMSEVGEDAYFNVGVVPGTNQHGAALWLNQLNITDGAKIFVEAGKKLNQTLTLTQSDLSVLDYEGIQVFLQSDCDDSLIDYVTLEAHFQPACTDINFAVNNTVINGNNPNASITLTANGYDKSFSSLQAIKLQMRGSADNYWTTLATYNASQTDATAADYIPDNGSISYVFDMTNYTDGTYVFRAVTECSFGSDEIEGESNEVAVVKDTVSPMLIAMPSPSDGVLDFGDEISATFNEDIQKNLLSKADNFFVRGVLNGARVTHDVALNMTGAEAAQTEARIDLSARDFTIETWLNWSAAGTLLQHGSADNNMKVGVDAQGHLTVNIGEQTYTSTAAIPANKWVYLALNYIYDAENEQGKLTAHYAKDDDEVQLFDRVEAVAYTGNGTLTVGKSITGQAHELTLWNTNRLWAESLSEMYSTKSNYTPNLIGYWPLNEGHGNAGTDRSRSRNLTVADNAWYIYGDNYTLQLNGSTKAVANIGDITTTSSESYEIETWFRIDESQSTAGSIVATNNGNLQLKVNASGALEIVANGSTYSVGNEDYRDGQWHHLALNVLKNTGGSAIVYVDGVQKRQMSAAQVPSLQAASLYLGENLKGAIDELRIWHGRRTSDVIKENMFARVAADEPGLVAYYPMETSTVGSDGQVHFNASLTDLTHSAKTITAASGTLSTSTTNSAPIQALRTSNNVEFTFAPSERKILITLDELAAKTEGCTVQFTLSNVRDMQNNICEPITWSAYIRQNQLRWGQQEVEVRKLDDDVATFDVDVVNRGGSTQNWVISDLPSWLSVSSESGTLEAQATKTVTFTVDAATAIGTHEAEIYLTGDMNIREALVVKVTSAVTPPEWAVNAEGYESTMNVVGQLQIDGTISEDAEDIVAAFRGNECVGLAHPLYLNKYDAYFVMLTVYGNADDSDVDLTFKVFDASTGTTYPMVATSVDVDFNPDYLVGTFAAPVIFNPQDAIEQTLALKKGWAWTSLYVTPTDNSVSAIFKDNGDEVTYVKNKSAFAQLNGTNFVGSLTNMVVGDMYKVNATTATTTSVIGTPAVPTEVEMTIAKGWNWIGYNCGSFNTLENAFADLNPVDGDIIKSQGPFCIYDDGEWVGNLSLMTPGQGYCYWSEATTTKTFHYPTVAASKAPRRAPGHIAEDEVFVNTDYEGNMSIVAIVMDGGEVLSDAKITVVSDSEVRGFSTRAVRDDIHFVSVAGKGSGDKLTFMVSYDGCDYLLTQSEFYQNDAVLGSLKTPYVLNLNGATGIQGIEGDENETIYDLAGRKLERLNQNHGVFIVNGRKIVK